MKREPVVPKSDLAASTSGVAENAFLPSASPAMRMVEKTIQDIASTDIPVLIEGESGTGKRTVAIRIYQLSGRTQKQFLKLNCATLTPDFFKPQTQAIPDQSKPWGGAGTLFLDEIGELDSICQPKLLHNLPDGREPTGGNGTAVRLIASTARILENEMRAGRFREDLYYRISGVCLRLPPLRHRPEDIPGLVDYFLNKYAALLSRPKPELGPAALRMLIDYSWPGNIRELEYAVQKVIALGDDRRALADLYRAPKALGSNGKGIFSLKQAARVASLQAERELILKALSHTRWNRKRAAEELRISYKALLYKMKQIGLNSADS